MLALTFAALIATVTALSGIRVPDSIKSGTEFSATFENAGDSKYRVYVAAALAGSNGPTCYLVNSTTLDSSVSLTVPADVGPTADYYSIAIADITTGQASTFSNRFNLTNANGTYSKYENKLGGSPFWSANSLPCSAYSCARECADTFYPGDLTEVKAYDTMSNCILACDGVTASVNQTAPAHLTTTSEESASGTESTAAETSIGAASRYSVARLAVAGVVGGVVLVL